MYVCKRKRWTEREVETGGIQGGREGEGERERAEIATFHYHPPPPHPPHLHHHTAYPNCTTGQHCGLEVVTFYCSNVNLFGVNTSLAHTDGIKAISQNAIICITLQFWLSLFRSAQCTPSCPKQTTRVNITQT